MRFRPPRVPLPAELDWLLHAAFGPGLPPLAGEPSAIAELAGRFDLGPRIVARHGAAALQDRLGDAAAGPIQAHRRAIAVALAAESAARRLARVAAGEGLELLFLKGYALERLLRGPDGWRPYVDLDVLLERSAAERLRAGLLADGWTSSVEDANPQHLPPIRSPEGTPLDIHYRLRGVRVAADRWAGAGELLTAGLCQPAGLGDGSWLPKAPLMAAHLAVHALEQHGHRPATYPLLRAVADIADLTAAAPGDDLEAQARPLVGDTLAEDESRALFQLARRLSDGDPAFERGAEEAETLLRHIVAGALDGGYRDGLALDHTAGRLRQARRDGQLMRYIAQKLRGPGEPPRAGPTGSAERSRAWRRRLLHPFRLCARFANAAAARLRRAIDR